MGRLAFDILLCFLAFTLIPVIVFRYVDPPTTPLMWIRWSSSDTESPRSLDTWQSLENISPHLLKAVIEGSDGE